MPNQNGNFTHNQSDKSATNTPSGAGVEVKGFELDQDRPYGKNSDWAPEGGQPTIIQKDGSEAPSVNESPEPTHIGRTQSTTNSQ